MEYDIKITKEQIKILNDTFCVYENGTKKGEIPFNCDKCILRSIKYIACIKEWKMIDEHITHTKEVVKDLCFGIYHDGILTDNPIYTSLNLKL